MAGSYIIFLVHLLDDFFSSHCLRFLPLKHKCEHTEKEREKSVGNEKGREDGRKRKRHKQHNNNELLSSLVASYIITMGFFLALNFERFILCVSLRFVSFSIYTQHILYSFPHRFHTLCLRKCSYFTSPNARCSVENCLSHPQLYGVCVSALHLFWNCWNLNQELVI